MLPWLWRLNWSGEKGLGDFLVSLLSPPWDGHIVAHSCCVFIPLLSLWKVSRGHKSTDEREEQPPQVTRAPPSAFSKVARLKNQKE